MAGKKIKRTHSSSISKSSGPRFFCDTCSAEVPLKADRCPSCGRFFSSVLCPRCGHSGPEKDFTKGCPSCGYSAGKGRTQNPGKRESRGENKEGVGELSCWAIFIVCLFLAIALFFFFRFLLT